MGDSKAQRQTPVSAHLKVPTHPAEANDWLLPISTPLLLLLRRRAIQYSPFSRAQRTARAGSGAAVRAAVQTPRERCLSHERPAWPHAATTCQTHSRHHRSRNRRAGGPGRSLRPPSPRKVIRPLAKNRGGALSDHPGSQRARMHTHDGDKICAKTDERAYLVDCPGLPSSCAYALALGSEAGESIARRR